LEFSEWEPFYIQIQKDFGFSRAKDEESARLLSELVRGKKSCGDACLREIIGEEVTVCGHAPRLEKDLEGRKLRGTVIVADGATSILMERGIVPQLIVSDLDGEIAPQVRANSIGSVAVIHAHGDNMERLREFVPLFKGKVIASTQSRPFGNVRNYGGFTDGDRGVVLARHFGAKRILLLGFDFSAPREKAGKDINTKSRKLEWARKLVYELNPRNVVLLTP